MIWIEWFYRQGFPCLFHLFTGLYCLGCGGTRAFRLLLQGKLRESWIYHPLVLYMAAAVLIEIGIFIVQKLRKRRTSNEKRLVYYTYVGIVIVVVNCIWKNYMLLARGIDLLPAFS